MLGIDLTYGTDTLQGALFVHSIKPGSPAELYGRPLLHDQIVKVKYSVLSASSFLLFFNLS